MKKVPDGFTGLGAEIQELLVARAVASWIDQHLDRDPRPVIAAVERVMAIVRAQPRTHRLNSRIETVFRLLAGDA